MSKYVEKLVKQARESSYRLASLPAGKKNKILIRMARALIEQGDFILRENKKDIISARKSNLNSSFIDRLALNDKRLKEMSLCLREVAALPDPVGELLSSKRRPNGMIVNKVRVPIGVILIVYESRPNVTSDCVGLLFKSSNVGILRGGKDAVNSNRAVGKVLSGVLSQEKVDFPVFFVVDNTDRRVVGELLKQDQHIDLVIPRGGESLIRRVVEESSIPVIKHYKGVCHIFVDQSADQKQALRICVNAKTQRPSVCNAVETILVHKSIAEKFLPLLKGEFDRLVVQIRGDKKTCRLIPGIKKASAGDWSCEYLDLVVSIKVVADTDEAIRHINTYGSHHTDSIITKSRKNGGKFVKGVDSACCFVNISTRFSDGHQFGLGAEIGISTDKLHARGPMGL
ncbi:MAG: glutamate-5-semialdehyde dehydrogenase, partial [Candidatus Omnitrophota bacterium]